MKYIVSYYQKNYNYQFMDLDQQQQKGLFTFYREQADFQDQLKSRKLRLSEGKIQKIEEKDKRISINPQPSPKYSSDPFTKRQQRRSLLQSQEKVDQQIKKTVNSKDKLISILKRNQAKEMNHEIKIVLQNSEQASCYSQKLKERLQKLLMDDQNQYFKLIMAEKALNNNLSKNLGPINKQQTRILIRPFQKLALLPTTFATDFQEIITPRNLKKNKPSVPKKLSSSLDIRKADKKNQIESSFIQPFKFQQIVKRRVDLPKIEKRSSSEYIKSKKEEKLKDIKPKSDRWLSVQSSQLRKNQPNKIYSIFIQNPDSQRNHLEKPSSLGQILRRLNFV